MEEFVIVDRVSLGEEVYSYLRQRDIRWDRR